MATAWEQAAQREALRHQAQHDGLTGLPNRALFLDRLERAFRPGERDRGLAVALLDLDGFKGVNDTLGHAAGDQVLRACARTLLAELRPQDTLARLGGDEFALLCLDVPDAPAALELTTRLQRASRRPLAGTQPRVTVPASIGVALAPATGDAAGAGGRNGEGLLREADAALYAAKERGRNQVQLFDAALQDHLVSRRRREAELRTALERGELRLHYQPVRSTSDGDLLGIEALVRWEHLSTGCCRPASSCRWPRRPA